MPKTLESTKPPTADEIAEFADSGENISRHFPMAVFHCEREMISALHSEAEKMGVKSWEVILRADAQPRESRDGRNLSKLAERAAETVANQLRQRKEPTVVVYPGLLARY